MNSPCVNCGADLRICKECDWHNGVWISKDQYEARLKADLKAILVELQLEMEELEEEASIGKVIMIGAMDRLIQQKIDLLQKQGTNNCDNCFNGTTKGECAIKELMKNKDCKYYMPRKINDLGDNENE